MKKLCFSTISSILVKCKVKSAKQYQLCSAILTSIPGVSDIGLTESVLSNLVHGKANVGLEVIALAPDCDRHIFADNLQASDMKMVDDNRRREIILALKDVIAEDNSIKPDTTIEMINNQTKEAILERDDFVFTDFIAGLLLYVILNTENRGTKEAADEITQAYIDSFSCHTSEISLISNYGDISSVISTSAPADSHVLAMIAVTSGKCLCCGKPLIVTENGVSSSRAVCVTLSENSEIMLCADCSCKTQTMTEDEKKLLISRQQEIEKITEARATVSEDRLPDQIESLLRAITLMPAPSNAHLKLDPVTIENKIHEMLLLERVKSDVLHYYDEVNDILDRLAGENGLNVTKFSRQMRRMFEDAAEMLEDQSGIYHLLIDQLYDRTGYKYREACEIVVSCFVQRCEVFDAIAE